jgi:hypothetical protein
MEGLALVRLDQRRIHVQRRRGRRLMRLHELQQRLVHPPKAAQLLRHRRNEGCPRDRLRRGRIMEPLQPARQRRRRGRRPLALAPPAALQRPPLGARQQLLLDCAQNRAEPVVALQPFDVFDAIPAGEVQEDRRHNHLDVEPALAPSRPHMAPNRRAEPAGLDQIEIHEKTGKGGQTVAGRIGLILEIEQALCPHRAPRGDGFRIAIQHYLPDSSGPTGNFSFLMPNRGRDLWPILGERARRLFVAAEARALGRGGGLASWRKRPASPAARSIAG